MSFEFERGKMPIREASAADIAIMAAHHGKMFEEIWEHKGEHLQPARIAEIEKAYRQKLETEMESGTCKAWIVEDEEQVVASGALTFMSLVPNPSDLSSKVAYLHSMYTEKSHRNKKCAQQIMHNMISYCSSHGIKRVLLNASDAGQPVYHKFGFRSTPDTMRLLVP
jgi:GNAT superfamily N-acetyltransferase